MEGSLQQGSTSFVLGLPTACAPVPAGLRTATPHTCRHAAVSLNPVQNTGQATQGWISERLGL